MEQERPTRFSPWIEARVADVLAAPAPITKIRKLYSRVLHDRPFRVDNMRVYVQERFFEEFKTHVDIPFEERIERSARTLLSELVDIHYFSTFLYARSTEPSPVQHAAIDDVLWYRSLPGYKNPKENELTIPIDTQLDMHKWFNTGFSPDTML